MKEKKYVWNIDDLLNGKKADVILDEVKLLVREFAKNKNKLTNDVSSKEVLLFILLKEDIYSKFSKVSAFYSLKFNENTSDEEALAKLSYLNQLGSELENELMFFNIWFMDLDEHRARKIIESSDLKVYKGYLESVRLAKKHTLKEDIEKILSLKNVTGGGAFAGIYEVFTGGFTFEFDGKELTQEELTAKYKSMAPEERKKAYDVVYGKFSDNSVVLAEMYKNIVLDSYNELVKIRNYDSPISARNLSNRVSDKSVSALLNVVRKNVALFRDFFRLKHELLKKNNQSCDFSRYHIYAPFDYGSDEKFDFETSKKIVLETYKNFDKRFYDAAKSIFDANHVHSHPQKNKRSGAFCFDVTNKDTPYILLNHTDTSRDVFTMMHEFGHGIHDIFSSKQPNLVSHAKLPLAETASVFGEMLLASRWIDEAKNPKKKVSLLIQLLDNQWSTIIRQAYFIIFENWAHENIRLGKTKKEIDEFYYSLLKEQFGDMEIPEVFSHEWNYVPHIHASPFYCYAYAWGNLLVLSFYAMYKEQGKSFVDKYVNFLSEGSSKSTTDILKDMGVDPESEEFWQKGFDIIKKEVEDLKFLTSKF